MIPGYIDPDFGFFDDVIEQVLAPMDAWIASGAHIDESGIERIRFKKRKIRAHLQAYSRQEQPANGVGPSVTVRLGKLYLGYDTKLNEGDIVRHKSNYYRLKDPTDYDYVGVQYYEVVRIGLGEVTTLGILNIPEEL